LVNTVGHTVAAERNMIGTGHDRKSSKDLGWRAERRRSEGLCAGSGLKRLLAWRVAWSMAQRAANALLAAPSEGIRHKAQPDIEGIETRLCSCS
jgi:hypothetical protein